MNRNISGIDAIGRTALAVTTLRAAEHHAPDALFADPYAEHFLHAAGDMLGPRQRAQAFTALMQTQAVVRTRFFDDHLHSATGRGCRQVVLVASGMDSRPWRLQWPAGTIVYDVDQEPVLEFKNAVMRRHASPNAATRRAVPIDLRTDWTARLRTEGFRDSLSTAWLVEGLLYSLDEQACDRLLTTVTRLSSPGSTLAFDHFEVGPSLRAATDRISPALTQLWQTGPTDPASWLRRHGWQPALRELADVAARFGRTPHPAYIPGPQAEGRSWLATAALT
ncbi:SAM-dependent methyltransferase [Streptomyces sp. NPDC001089]